MLVMSGDLPELQNAGVNLLGDSPIEENDMAKFKSVLETNIMAAVLVCADTSAFPTERELTTGTVYEAGFPAHEHTVTTRRPNHQQRVHLRRRPSSKFVPFISSYTHLCARD